MERIPPDGRSSCSRAENALDLLRPSVIILHSVPTHGCRADDYKNGTPTGLF